MKFNLLYIPISNYQEASTLAKKLVTEKLVACANVINTMTSFYFWENQLQEEAECLVLAKSREELFPLIQKRVEEIHPYACPCILALPLLQGNAAYLQWIKDNTMDLA